MADSNAPNELRKYSFDELDAKGIHDAAVPGASSFIWSNMES